MLYKDTKAMIHPIDDGTDCLDIIPGVLHRDKFKPLQFMICQNYDLMQENCFPLKKNKRFDYQLTITHKKYSCGRWHK